MTQLDQELWFEEFIDQEVRELNNQDLSDENPILDVPF
jgi:hypothetical protein